MTRLYVKDPKTLKRLMAVDNISARQLAAGVGYRSHSYVNRILAGVVTTVTIDRGARIARFLHVDVSDLFAPEPSAPAAQNVSRERAS